MGGRTRRGLCVLVAAALVAAAASACARGGDLEVSNLGPGEVVVLTGDESFTVQPDGGVLILDYGCTPGDVTVRFTDGGERVVPGPVCSDERLVIHDGEVTVKPARTDAA